MLPATLGRWFTRSEVERVSDAIPLEYESNALRTVALLDQLRTLIGAPIVLTSFYRNVAHNARVEGSDTSDHMHALAADFYVYGMDLRAFYARVMELERTGRMPPYDQLILYPFTTKHAHIGIGPRMRRQHLLRVSEVERERTGHAYTGLVSLSQIPKGAAAFVVVLLLAVVALWFVLHSKLGR